MSNTTVPTTWPDQASTLRGVTWDEYVRYRDDPANQGSRMTYSQEVLEIMTLSYFHEVWRWRNEAILVLRLENGQYTELSESIALPGFPLEQLRHALARRNELSQTVLVREFQNHLLNSR